MIPTLEELNQNHRRELESRGALYGVECAKVFLGMLITNYPGGETLTERDAAKMVCNTPDMKWSGLVVNSPDFRETIARTFDEIGGDFDMNLVLPYTCLFQEHAAVSMRDYITGLAS